VKIIGESDTEVGLILTKQDVAALMGCVARLRPTAALSYARETYTHLEPHELKDATAMFLWLHDWVNKR
jgi:hypothetical protein